MYLGADGRFALYEDEGDGYRYEKGVHSEITFRWEEAKRQLVVKSRKGSFPGMLARRKFNLALISSQNGAGLQPAKLVKTVAYDGKELVVKL